MPQKNRNKNIKTHCSFCAFSTLMGTRNLLGHMVFKHDLKLSEAKALIDGGKIKVVAGVAEGDGGSLQKEAMKIWKNLQQSKRPG